jgi:hypothetical protein
MRDRVSGGSLIEPFPDCNFVEPFPGRRERYDLVQGIYFVINTEAVPVASVTNLSAAITAAKWTSACTVSAVSTGSHSALSTARL